MHGKKVFQALLLAGFAIVLMNSFNELNLQALERIAVEFARLEF
jgi:hypothetical protein